MDLSKLISESLVTTITTLGAAVSAADETESPFGAPDSPAYRFLVGKTVVAVRSADTTELANAAEKLDRLLREIPDATSKTQLDVLADVMSSAASRTDPTAVPAIMQTLGGKAALALKILKNPAGSELIQGGEPEGCLWHSSIAGHLGMSTSNASHLIGDLVRAGLVDRHRVGSRVSLCLTGEGLSYVATHYPDEARVGPGYQSPWMLIPGPASHPPPNIGSTKLSVVVSQPARASRTFEHA